MGPVPPRSQVRRSLVVALVLIGVGGLGACTSEAGGDGVGSRSAASSTSVPPPSSTTTTLPEVVPFVLGPDEPVPEVKATATLAVEALGNYGFGEDGIAAAQVRLAGLPVAVEVAEQAGPLLVPGSASRLEVVYPQLGGLTGDAASVMTVVRQRLFSATGESIVTRTVDVRLAFSANSWTVTSLASVGGEPPTVAAPSPIGATVLANPRIELPDSARWDIESGRVGDQLLTVLDRLGVAHTLSVTVLASGHPHEVFGGTSVSNHTEGRGVDIWAVDGVPVASAHAVDSPVYVLVQQLLAEGVTELGSPWDLDGPGQGASFTNTVHQDHLHIAFDG